MYMYVCTGCIHLSIYCNNTTTFWIKKTPLASRCRVCGTDGRVIIKYNSVHPGYFLIALYFPFYLHSSESPEVV